MPPDGVETFRVGDSPYPWRFRVRYRGETFNFAGVPNQCPTRRSAAIRGWWRLRWLRAGTFYSRYRAPA